MYLFLAVRINGRNTIVVVVVVVVVVESWAVPSPSESVQHSVL